MSTSLDVSMMRFSPLLWPMHWIQQLEQRRRCCKPWVQLRQAKRSPGRCVVADSPPRGAVGGCQKEGKAMSSQGTGISVRTTLYRADQRGCLHCIDQKLLQAAQTAEIMLIFLCDLCPFSFWFLSASPLQVQQISLQVTRALTGVRHMLQA